MPYISHNNFGHLLGLKNGLLYQGLLYRGSTVSVKSHMAGEAYPKSTKLAAVGIGVP